MRFMLLMYPNPLAEQGAMPTVEQVSAMMEFNAELGKAGALIALDGLHPSSAGARVRFGGGQPSVTDGPFTESNEIVGGYWVIKARSKEEAIEWAGKCPASPGDMIEIRQIFEMTDFPEDVQKAAEPFEIDLPRDF